MAALLSLSAVELARRIRERTLSPVDVVEAHIARIQALGGALNAVVTPTFATARQEAIEAAAAVERGAPLGPLHGVPFTAKDCLDVAGVRSTCGLSARAEHYPTQDAVVVARLRAAGGILLGKTNVPDNCWGQETENLLFGRTNNPWDASRTVGGSSGGEAAVIAACGSPLGIGTDIAGSIRLPAHFTGIVGLRPTSAALSEVGNWPVAVGRQAGLEAIGPLARRVEDVALAFDLMRGTQHQPPDPATLAGARVAYWLDDGLVPASPAVRAGVQAAVEALRACGMQLQQAMPAAARLATLGWLAYQGKVERDATARGMGGGEHWSLLGEIWRALRGQARVWPGALLYWAGSDLGSRLMAALGIDGVAWRGRLRAQFAELVGSGGVAVCPIFPTSAPRHGWSWHNLAPLTTLHYQSWVNLAGLPGLTVPVGRSGNGLPIGVQVVGLPGAEQTVLAAGLAIQQQLMPLWRGPAN